MKRVSFLAAILILISVVICACQSEKIDRADIIDAEGGKVTDSSTNSNVDRVAIEKAVTHIEAGELDKAISVCQSMDAETREECVTTVLDCVLVELKYYLNFNNWTSTEYELVDPDAIEKLKKFQSLLALLPLEEAFTNATEFLDTAIMAEKYVEWNDYYNADDTYLEDVMEYMNQGASYKSTSWSIAVTYYEKAYVLANTAHNHFSGSYASGMYEAAEWYRVFAEQIKRTINREKTTLSQESEYNAASAAYGQMLAEYLASNSEMIELLESFPKKLY